MNALHRLARILYPFGSRRRILRGPARGFRYVVELGFGLSYALATEDAAPSVFEERLEPGMTIFDIGANKGQMALLFAALVGSSGKVVAFEPSEAENASLKRNLALNGIDHVHPVCAAAFSRNGDVRFMYSPERPTRGRVAGVEATYTQPSATQKTVPTVRVDDVVEVEGPPDFIKIDVEGAAAAVLAGAGHTLDRYAPTLYVELHGPEEQAGIRDHLVGRGYVLETLDGRPVADPTEGWYSPLWCFKP